MPGARWRFWLIAALALGSLLLGVGGLRQASAQSSGDQAATLRFNLDQLLSEHADLAIIAMQKGYDGAADFQAAADQLSKNTDALTGAIQSVYGNDAANQFKTLWTNHIGFFVNYAQAVKANDSAKKQRAVNDLAGYKTQIATFLSGANPNLSNAAVQQTFQTHIDQLTGALDAYAGKDYAKAYSLFDQSHAHMFMTGNTLAGAIAKQFPQKFPGDASSPAADLQASLDQLLSEHADLTVLGMQRIYDGAPDVQALSNQLSQNTDQLSQAIGSVYGAGAASQFKTIWTNHVGFFVNYAQAVKANDSAKKQQALTDLAGYKAQIAALLSGANPNLDNGTVQQVFQAHIDQLSGALDAYESKDYAKAYSLFDQAQAHMFMAGGALAGAIAKQFPQKFPATAMQMPNTGTGGFAATDHGLDPAVELGLAALAAVMLGGGLVLLARRTE